MPNKVATNVLSWASDIEPGTIDQAARSARLPFLAGHLALMPDAHVGFGSTIGSVIPTKGAIIPSAIGVDIGCGVISTRTSLTASDLPDDLSKLMPLVEARIPAGVGQGHADPAVDVSLSALGRPQTELDTKQERTTACQFGTLGSGNHFVEVCLDENDQVWTLLHSGSRGIGNQLATKHITQAKKLMAQYFITLEDPDLAYLVQGTPEFTHYIRDMLWAQAYALASRARMDRAVVDSLFEVVGHGERVDTINCHHNFTQQEYVCLTCVNMSTRDSEPPALELHRDAKQSTIRDFLESCRIGFHSCDGLALWSSQDGREFPPLLKGVLLRTLDCLPESDRDALLTHIRPGQPFRPCNCRKTPPAMPAFSRSLGNTSSVLLPLLTRELEKLPDTQDRSSLLSFLGISWPPYSYSSSGCGGKNKHHHGQDMWITRKGAVKADVGDQGVIPGSMGTRSYVVSGLGNPSSYNSCSHGAGRRMSRTQARKELTAESLTEAMGDRTWNANRASSLVDEHPLAYKSIDQVMADQTDLASVDHTLRQIFNYKG